MPSYVTNNIAWRQAIGLGKKNIERDSRRAHLREPVHKSSHSIPGPRPLPELAQRSFIYVDDPDRHLLEGPGRPALVLVERRLAGQLQRLRVDLPAGP